MELMVNKRSSRPIKRKRFDDDVIDDNMDQIFHNRPETAEGSSAVVASGVADSAEDQVTSGSGLGPLTLSHVPTNQYRPVPDVNAPLPAGKKHPRIGGADENSSVVASTKMAKRKKIRSSKRMKNRNKFLNSIWRPEDDLLLIDAVIQTNDLNAVYCAVKFSTYFSMKEIQERWEALLFDSSVSQSSRDAIASLPLDIRNKLLSRALFSEAEELILMDLSFLKTPSLEAFALLLNKHRNVFHQYRTPKLLRKHWFLLKRFLLLTNQRVPPSGQSGESFSDLEERVVETAPSVLECPLMTDPVIQNEINVADLRDKEEIKLLELEIPRWQFLLTQITGQKNSQFDGQTLAVLRGKSVRYLMRSREITIGRSCKGHAVDVDLSLEGPALKISRLQGMIKLVTNGSFFLHNCGKRPVFVDGQAVLPGSRCKLFDNSIVIICKLALLFLINSKLVSLFQEECNKQILNNTTVSVNEPS